MRNIFGYISVFIYRVNRNTWYNWEFILSFRLFWVIFFHPLASCTIFNVPYYGPPCIYSYKITLRNVCCTDLTYRLFFPFLHGSWVERHNFHFLLCNSRESLSAELYSQIKWYGIRYRRSLKQSSSPRGTAHKTSLTVFIFLFDVYTTYTLRRSFAIVISFATQCFEMCMCWASTLQWVLTCHYLKVHGTYLFP